MSHFYNSDIGKLPSVTTILQDVLPEHPGLEKWRKKNKSWKLDLKRSQVHGTLIHHRILHEYHAGYLELPNISFDEWFEDTQDMIEDAVYMWNTLPLEIGFPRRVEFGVVNTVERYAGKLDMLAPISYNGSEMVSHLLDIKTSKHAYETHTLQLGGYYGALPDGIKPKKAIIVGLPVSTGELKPHVKVLSEDELKQECDAFFKLAREWHSKYDAEEEMKLRGVETE